MTSLQTAPRLAASAIRALAALILALLAAAVPAAAAGILVVAPHPDDDVITSAGVIRRAVSRGEVVHVVFVTNGDYTGPSDGIIRQGEAVAAQDVLGVPEANLIFLGYPDGWLKTIWENYTLPASQFTTPPPHNQAFTYGVRGLGLKDYHSHRFGSPAAYNRPNMIQDMADILSHETFGLPTHIFVTSEFDQHDDHETSYRLVQQALAEVIPSHPGYNPTVHKTTVWPGGPSWPAALDPTAYFTPIPNLSGTGLVWSERESIDVPLTMQSTQFGSNDKYLAVLAHPSQDGTGQFLGRWIHKDEFFWTEQHTGTNQPPVPHAGYDQSVSSGATVTLDGTASFDRNGDPLSYQWVQLGGIPVTLSGAATASPTFTAPTGLSEDATLSFGLMVGDGSLQSIPDGVNVMVDSGAPEPDYGPNVAPAAAVTASTETAPNQSAIKAVDEIVDGYREHGPFDATREWVTEGQQAGAWIQLTWSGSRSLGRVILYDRPNQNDHILAGTLSFSDDSTVPVGPLDNFASPGVYSFAERAVTWVRLTVNQTSASTANVGLAEFEAFEVVPTGSNRPPVARAGPDYTVNAGVLVELDGSTSSDLDQDPLTYAWVQTAGPTVVLSDPTAVRPTFTAPSPAQSTVLTFSLIVNDGEVDSAPDFVSITVLPPPGPNEPPVADAGSDQTAYMGVTVQLMGVGSSDPDDDPITYQWTQLSGISVTLSDAHASNPRFTSPTGLTANETLTFRLVVNDGTIDSAPDLANVVVIPQNQPPPGSNIAPLALPSGVEASSQNADTQQYARKAVDEVVDGYPGDHTREWATLEERAGAYIKLTWTSAHTIDRVVLHDRPNSDDQILSATLSFSDGSSVGVGALLDNGGAVEVPFSARSVTWVRLTVNSVSAATLNVGLAEILVYDVFQDTDSDGVADGNDNCPSTANSQQIDADIDGLGDACDTCPNDALNDADADGVCGNVDNCPATSNPFQIDTDFDGLGDACDGDIDNDGVMNATDNCPTTPNVQQTDTDLDGLGDACDEDIDNDGVMNATDNCPTTPNVQQTDTDSDGLGDACDTCPNDALNDADADGVCGNVDNCPTTPNVQQSDTDSDGLGDACDADIDNDGVMNAADNCPTTPNVQQTDTDSDGLGDACDEDIDNDGVMNAADNCPTTPNVQQTDTDSDGLGDACDEDIDNDGVMNAADNCPTTPNVQQTDTDLDGLGDACDTCPNDALNDADADGVCGNVDNCPATSNPFQIDTDLDGLGDACDADIDNDGVMNAADNCPTTPNVQQTDTDSDGLGDACDEDIDNDGVMNAADNCPTTPNVQQTDTDLDGLGDACDEDIDNDGVMNAADNCPSTANSQQTDADIDGLGDACDTCPNDALNDADADGVCGNVDNCPATSNPFQIDTDLDGLGDACDGDIDNDGVMNAADNCPTTPNVQQTDTDLDGLGDACDTCPNDALNDADADGVCGNVDNCPTTPNVQQSDTDSDGLGDACDADIDNDGVMNAADNCPTTPNVQQTDTDLDGLGDACDADIDNDGVMNAADNCPATPNVQQTDTDSDGLGDACDADIDNDGVMNAADNCPATPNVQQTDTDSDGLGDACDADIDNDGVVNASDCAAADDTVWAIPGEVSGVTFAADHVTISWNASGGAVGPTYNVLRGALFELPVGSGSQESCLSSDPTETQAGDSDQPGSELGYWYLVRAHDACGSGTYGFMSNLSERTSSTCP